jgi:CelD/BcsL family acetyltransferase involved in cellulose biosynthesis
MRVELTDDPTAFRTHDWTPLVEADPAGTVFHTPAFLKLWWEEFGTGRLILAFAREDGETVGAGAFESIDGRLQFLGGFDVTDYLGPVARPGREAEVAAGMLDALAGLGWTRADLAGLAEGSPWFEALEGAAAGCGFLVERGDDGVAPLIELEGSFDAYLDALPTKLRHEMRRKERRLADQAGGYEVTWASASTLSRDVDRFVELHQASPGPKGRFLHPGMELFFRRLAGALLEQGWFQLAFIEVDGTKAAGAMGFSFGDTFSLYNSAFDRDFERLSPGMVLVTRLIRDAAERGLRRFDMLKGDLAYKYRFGARPRPVHRLVLKRPG